MLWGFIVVVFVATVGKAPIAYGKEGGYWPTIKELLKKDTPQGNPELAKYLKSLDKEQLLTALRQYCSWIETQPLNKREWAEVISMRILVRYAEPLKRSDLPEKEFQEKIVRFGKQRNLEDGLIPAGFSDSAFDKLITTIADQKEGAYFRWTLAVLLSDDEYFFPVLSKTQKDRYFDTCLTVLNDRGSPDMARTGCLKALWKVFSREYRHIIYDDDVVKELMGTGSREEERNANSLLDSGKINLTSKTIEQLRPWRKRIFDFRKKLVALLADEQEPEMIRKEAKRQLHWLDRLPLIDVNDTTPKPPKN